jgi:6-phosphofructokinase 1
VIYLDPRPFREAFGEFGEYKEGQDNVVLLTFEQDRLSGYSTAVGLSARERAARDVWATVERERRDRVTAPGRIRQLVALVSGGDFAGAGAALRSCARPAIGWGSRSTSCGTDFLGWPTTGSSACPAGHARDGEQASSPVGSSRFEDFGTSGCSGPRCAEPTSGTGPGRDRGDGSLRGARAVFEGFGVQVVGIPGTIDNNLAATTSLGFHSAVALANQSLESLKATSAAMGSVFFVEVMGAGSGHLALACAYQARAEGLLINEHPDPDAYIDGAILGAPADARCANKATCSSWRSGRRTATTRTGACTVWSVRGRAIADWPASRPVPTGIP